MEHPRTVFLVALGVFVLALLVHGVTALQYRHDPFLQTYVSDALSYHEWAARIATHGLDPEPVFHQAPLFPVLLAGVYRLGAPEGAAFRAILFQIVAGSAAIALLVPMGRLYMRSTIAGMTAGLIALLYAPVAFYGMKLLPIPLALLTQAAALVLLAAARETRDRWPSALAGLACGAACLARTEMLLFVPVAMVALYLPIAPPPPRPRWVKPLLFLVGVGLALSPATAHNAARGDRVVISAAAGENLFIGNQRGADGGHTPLHDQAGDLYSQRALAEIVAEDALGRELRPSEISAYWRSRAVEEILAEPGRWLVLETRKLWRILSPGDPTDMYSLPLERRHYLTVLYALPVSNWGLWFLAAGGLYLALRRVGSTAWPLVAFVSVHLFVLMAFFVSTRLKMPLMFSLTPFAGLAVFDLWSSRRKPSRRRWIVATMAILLATSAHWLFVLRPSLREELRLVSVLSRQSRLEEALALLDPWVQDPNPEPLALDHAGWIRSKQGELAAAQRLYLRALEIGLPYPSSEAKTHSRLASVSERLGQFEFAATHHNAAVAVDPVSAGARHERAMFLLRRGETERAVADLRAAAGLEPRWEEPREVLRSLGLEPEVNPPARP